jgi:hypothetical protein
MASASAALLELNLEPAKSFLLTIAIAARLADKSALRMNGGWNKH